MKKILTIAGFDPSGGAGILRDATVCSSFQLECLGVLTCNTIQNDASFESVSWFSLEKIGKQIDILGDQDIAVIKIGLTKDIEMIRFVLDKVKSLFPKAKIVLDPILKTSSGFEMEHDAKQWKEIIDKVDVFTPNWTEMQVLSGVKDIETAAIDSIAIGWSKETAICLKGGHSPHPEMDLVFVSGKKTEIRGRNQKLDSRHGSGCMYSTSFACALAIESDSYHAYLEAARIAKDRTEEYLIEGSSEEQPKRKPLQSSLRMTDNNKAKSL